MLLAVPALLAGGWVWTGLHPRIVAGSMSGAPLGGLRLLNDGVADTRLVLDGARTGVLRMSLRNDGRVPITVLGLGDPDGASSPRTGWWQGARFGLVPVSEPYGFDAVTGYSVRVGPGQEAAVIVKVQAPECASYQQGSSLTVTQLPLRVRSLGLSHDYLFTLTLPLTITFAAQHAPAANCP